MDKHFCDHRNTQQLWDDDDFERAVLHFVSGAVVLFGGAGMEAQCLTLAAHMGGDSSGAEDVIEMLIKGRLPHDLSGVVATYAFARDKAEAARKAKAAKPRKARGRLTTPAKAKSPKAALGTPPPPVPAGRGLLHLVNSRHDHQDRHRPRRRGGPRQRGQPGHSSRWFVPAGLDRRRRCRGRICRTEAAGIARPQGGVSEGQHPQGHQVEGAGGRGSQAGGRHQERQSIRFRLCRAAFETLKPVVEDMKDDDNWSSPTIELDPEARVIGILTLHPEWTDAKMLRRPTWGALGCTTGRSSKLLAPP